MTVSFLEEILWVIFKTCLIGIFIVLLFEMVSFRLGRYLAMKKLFKRNQVGINGSVAGGTAQSFQPINKVVGGVQERRETQDVLPRERVDEKRPIIEKESIVQKNEIREKREKDKRRIGHILLENQLITKDILEQAVEHQKRYGGNITQYLLHYGYIDEKQLAQCLCAQFKVPYLPLEAYDISDEIIHLLPTDIVEKYWVLPVEKHGQALTVVMIDPLDTRVIKELEDITGLTIIPFIGIISEIVSALRVYYKIFIGDDAIKKPPFFIHTQTYTGRERRNSIRYPVPVRVQFPAQGSYLESQTIDVSRDGFSFIAQRSISPGEMLPLVLHLPGELSPFPITCVTQVVRCVPKAENIFEVAVKTIKISKEEIGMIIKYASQQRGS